MPGILSPLGSWQYQGLSLREAQAIAQSVVGAVSWNGVEGFCRCPGEGQHTTRTIATDCKVVCDAVEKLDGTLKPGVYAVSDRLCRVRDLHGERSNRSGVYDPAKRAGELSSRSQSVGRCDRKARHEEEPKGTATAQS